MSLLHFIAPMSKSIVRLAFDASVAKSAPAVRFHTNHASMVPMARCSSGGISLFWISHAAFVPEK